MVHTSFKIPARRNHFESLSSPTVFWRTKLPLFALVTAFFVWACSSSKNSLGVYGQPPGTFVIAVGQEIDIQMGTVGPGEYVSPPALMGSAILFVGESSPSVVVPSGAQQIFHFKGVASGQTIILFHNTSPPGSFRPDVIDIVAVR
jgi:hypothetical protein